MGHRASIAYIRDDGTVQAHYSHWGALEARIAFDTRLTWENPFGADGSPDTAARERMRTSLRSLDASREAFAEDMESDRIGDIDSVPYDSYGSLDEWAREGVNFLHHECAYVADPRETSDVGEPWPVRAFDTAWWKGPEGQDGSYTGILVELECGDEWGDFSHGTDENPAPDNTVEQDEWVASHIDWLGTAATRIPSFSPLPEDNRA
jgi:hypothetical protein